MAETPVVDNNQLSSSYSSSTLSDVVSSYHRSQTFLSSSIITTQHAFPEAWQYGSDEEVGHVQSEPDLLASDRDDVPTPRQVDYTEIDPLWDDAFQQSIAATAARPKPRVETERTPLLTSSTSLRPPIQQSHLLTRKNSTHSIVLKQPKYYSQSGNSTYRQTLFNSTAILLGIGMLSEPLAFAYAGWITGTILIIFYGFMTCYTAKILAKFIREDPNLRTYADIGLKAFGKKFTVLTGLLFCLELFSVSSRSHGLFINVVLITLYGDSLHLIIPTFTPDQYKLIAIVLLIPTMFLPLSILAYASVLGIVSTILIMGCIMIDGLSKFDAPGSLWQPADTVPYVVDARRVGVAFGLFMAGFGGHAVIPSLVRDMQDSSQFDGMINRSFGIATFVYGIIGAAGYLMFGNSVSQEISKNILEIPEYNRFLNNLTVWMLVIAPLTKYPLNTRPLSLTIEVWLGLDKPAFAQPHELGRPPSPSERPARVLETSPRTSRHPIPLVIERVLLVFLSVGVSILIPEFSTMMAFLGSFSAFVLCVVGPLAAKVAIQGSCGAFDAFLLAISIVFTVWGTVAAFM